MKEKRVRITNGGVWDGCVGTITGVATFPSFFVKIRGFISKNPKGTAFNANEFKRISEAEFQDTGEVAS